MNHGVVPSQRSRAKPIPKNSSNGQRDVHAMSERVVGSVGRVARGFVGKSFIGGDDRPTGRRRL